MDIVKDGAATGGAHPYGPGSHSRPADDGAGLRSAGVPVVELLSVEKTYPNGTRALDTIDLTIEDGEFVTLLGPSGCGKSTLLKLVAGLATPSEGRIRWWRQGFETVGLPGRKLAMVFQEATLMPWSRVHKNVRLPLALARVDRSTADRAVRAALELVGLEGFAQHYPRELSGGMQMRVSIARALVTEPNLLLMDEPFGALDEITRNKLDAELSLLWQKKSLTVAFVTHSIYESVFLSTRVAVMSARPGRIVHEMTIDEPFPRSESFRVSQRYAAHCNDLSEALAAASAADQA
jgi:NitT/TauT family transport system ATP-binding protein